ncbi:MAG: hypothetical protein GX624_12475 [Actinobacteria bacterium]|nr:hypothetical protein [Actinomycetota bacterium]
MDQDGMERCRTCPAFAKLEGSGNAGTCRAAPPVPLQADHYFRGSTRELPFGCYPVVGAFPLVGEEDYCMSHPGNRTKLM